MPESWSTVTSAVTTGMSAIVTTIKGEPLMLLPIGVSFIGACIGLAKGLFRFGRRRGR